ncbi:hypothetical protein LINPERPRIM_LOCUS3027 [Linum perenne]
MRGVIEGLNRAWDAGFRKIILRMDSRAAIAILTNGDMRMNQHAMETIKFHELMGRDWDMRVEHTFREGN